MAYHPSPISFIRGMEHRFLVGKGSFWSIARGGDYSRDLCLTFKNAKSLTGKILDRRIIELDRADSSIR